MTETFDGYLSILQKGPKEILQPRTCLNVGAWPGGTAFFPELWSAGWVIDVVEVFPKYVKALTPEVTANGGKIYTADIREWDPGKSWDLVLWWHGPEHMHKDSAERVIEKLSKIYRRWFVVGVPNGYYKQPPIDGNPQQEHVSHYSPDWFRVRGFCVETDRRGIIAWRAK